MSVTSVRLALALATCLVGTAHSHGGGETLGGVSGGPIHTLSARTLADGHLCLGLRADWADLDRRSDEELRRFAEQDIDAHSVDSVFALSFAAAYGLTGDLTVGAHGLYHENANVRHPHHDEDTDESSVESLGDAEGFGDLTLYIEWRFLHEDSAGVDVALVAGVETPAGERSVRTRQDELFEVDQQPGSGAWNPLCGVAASRDWGAFSLHAGVLYTRTTEGSRDTTLGARLFYGVAGVYRIAGPTEEECASCEDPVAARAAFSFDVMVEVVGEHEEKQEVDGERDDNTGGDILFIAPGVRFNLGGHWSIFASVSLPVAQDVNGEEHEVDFRAAVGVGVGF